MSLKTKALKALVVERLVVAADEIFALVERTFAEYRDELLQSKALQQRHVIIYKEDIQNVAVGADSTKSPSGENSALQILLSSVKMEENVNKLSLQKASVEENIQESVGEQYEAEEPGCSVDLHLDNNKQRNSCSDTHNSSDWELMNERSTTHKGQKRKALIENSAAKNFKNIQTVSVEANCGPELIKVKQEEDSAIKIPLPSVKSEENINTSTVEKDPTNGNNEQLSNCSDTDNSSDWELMDERSTKYKRQKLKAGFRKETLIRQSQDTYGCSVCGMEFMYRYTMLRHVRRIHNKERPYMCSVCQKSFFRNYDYISHMRIHTGERPFRCSVCDKSFRYKQSLKDHKC